MPWWPFATGSPEVPMAARMSSSNPPPTPPLPGGGPEAPTPVRETGKQRASRIPLDYFRHPTRLDWGRGWAAFALAVAVPAALVALGWARGGPGSAYGSRDDVATPHAMWNDNCAACHDPWNPISGETVFRPLVGNVHSAN